MTINFKKGNKVIIQDKVPGSLINKPTIATVVHVSFSSLTVKFKSFNGGNFNRWLCYKVGGVHFSNCGLGEPIRLVKPKKKIWI